MKHIIYNTLYIKASNTSAIYGSICCTYHQVKYQSPNHSKEQETHKKAYLSENGGLWKKKSEE